MAVALFLNLKGSHVYRTSEIYVIHDPKRVVCFLLIMLNPLRTSGLSKVWVRWALPKTNSIFHKICSVIQKFPVIQKTVA
jgi:hypothetical protein